MLNYYIDETYKTIKTGDLYCNIGGALVPHEKSVKLECELRHKQYEILRKAKGNPEVRDRRLMLLEIKTTQFLDQTYENEVKFQLLRQLVNILVKFDIKFLISHVKLTKKNQIHEIETSCTQEEYIQSYTFWQLVNHLKEFSKNNHIQVIIDGGLDKGFSNVYKLYSEGFRSCAFLSYFYKEKDITVPNFKNIAPPVFIDSKDSKLIQLSDIVIGLTLKKQMNQLNPFSQKLYDELQPLKSNIIIKPIELQKPINN